MSKFISVYTKNSEGHEVTSFVNVDEIKLIIPERNKTKLVFNTDFHIFVDEYLDDFVDRLSDCEVYFDTKSKK